MSRLLLESTDHARREAGADELALPHVRGAVHGDEHLAAHRRRVGQRGTVDGAEALSIAIRGLDVRVLREHPESLVLRLHRSSRKGMPEDRGFSAQRREQRVREAGADMRRVEEVDVEAR